MELRQLEYFVAVAQEENFTRAAERVHISQSGVSAQIKALETELGVTLFDRSGRTARLTDAGSAALRHAYEALDAAEALREVIDEVKGLVRGRLTIGMVTGCEVTPLFDALAGFHRSYPGVDLTLREDTSAELIVAVQAGLCDLALVGVAGEVPPGLAAQVIVSEGLAALVPAGHVLADRAGVTLDELRGHPLVCLPAGTGIRDVLDRSFVAGGASRRPALEATAPGAVADLAARGLGVGVLSRSMASSYGHLRAIPIEDVTLPALLALVWRRTPAPAVRALLPYCRDSFQAMPTASATTPDR